MVISSSGSSLRARDAAFVPAATPPKITSRINENPPALVYSLPDKSTGSAPGAKGSLSRPLYTPPGARRSPRTKIPGAPARYVTQLLLLGAPGGLVPPLGLVPVDHFPPRSYVLRAAVLVGEVVGMLPRSEEHTSELQSPDH